MESAARDMLQMEQADISLLNENTDAITMIQVKQLPSGFKGYPEGTKISFKPITLEELEALNSDDVDATRAIAMLLNSIHCTTMKSYDLYYWDVMFIGIQRKLLAFGETKGTVYARCPRCGELVSKSFSYTELEFKEITAPDLPMKMEVSGKKLEFKPLTVKDFLQINIEQGDLGVFARMIKNLDFEEAFELVKKATGTDIKKLKFMDKQLHYGMKPFRETCTNEIEIVNSNFDPEDPDSQETTLEVCGQEVVLEVRSPFEVVFPEDESECDNEFEVQYG